MAKVSSIYANETVFFATRHGKEEILAPLFRAEGIGCERVDVDTDQFGTFAGEIERQGTVRETLRKKISAAAKRSPEGRLFLASEGSFGPDPFLGFLDSDLESLLLWDKELRIEIYAEYLCRSPVHAEISLSPNDDVNGFLEKIGFPEHTVIVRPDDQYTPIFKGLNTKADVIRALSTSFARSQNGKAIILTDLRAHQNRARRNAIRKAGEALIEKIKSLCPQCAAPGFSISRGLPGLKCVECGEPSNVVSRAVILECVRCDYAEERPRPDGRTSLASDECENCNP